MVFPSSKYKGLRYINLLRCSDLTQADTSPDGQKAVDDAYAQNLGMVYVDDFYAEGVSGSQTFNREDIEALIRRKQERDDFDVIVVFELSRLTRGGTRHGWSVEDRLRKAGILLVSSTDAIPDGPEGEPVKSAKHYANQVQARGISLGVARGLAQSLERELRPAASRTPYAMDRLYIGPDQKPRMLTRWDGRTQIWYRADDHGNPLEEIGSRDKPPRLPRRADGRRRNRFRGYVKQSDETSQLVPGSKERRDALVFIFTAYDLWRWGYHRVCKELNDRGIPSPEDGQWTLSSVRNILFNPIYLGIEVRHRYSSALFHKLSPKGPMPVSVDQDQLERDHRKRVPLVERPREEWRLVDKPTLKDMLPGTVRALAMKRILDSIDPDKPPHPKKGKPIHLGEAARHRHMDSPYLLTHLLTAGQTGHLMRSETANRKMKEGRKQYRYYFDGSSAVYGKSGTAARRIPAEPIEQAVLNEVRQALVQLDDLDARIQAALQMGVDADKIQQQRKRLEDERSRCVKRVRRGYAMLGDIKDDGLVADLQRDSDRIKAIDGQLAKLDFADQPQQDVEQIVAAVRRRVAELDQSWDGMSNAAIKQVLAAMVDDLTIDLETLEVRFSIVLPSAMVRGQTEDGADDAVRLDCTWPWPSPVETNRPGSLEIAVVACSHRLEGRQGCYDCRRKRPAA